MLGKAGGVARTQMTGRRLGGRGARDSGVRRRGGSSDGQQWWVWGPATPVRAGEDEISINLGMAKLGGRSPERGKTAAALSKIQREREASGGRRRRYRHGSGGEGCGAQRRRSGVGDEGADEGGSGYVFERARSAARLRGKKEKRGGGPDVGVPHGVGAAWGLAPTGGRRPDRVPAGRDPDAACAGGASLFGQRHASTDGRAPVAVRAGRKRRGARGARARVGQPEKKNRVAKPR
jgi:hypothetical protein